MFKWSNIHAHESISGWGAHKALVSISHSFRREQVALQQVPHPLYLTAAERSALNGT